MHIHDQTSKKKIKREDILMIDLKANNNTLKSEIKATFDINFEPIDSLADLLGFKHTKLLANKRYISDFPANINHVNLIGIECNIATGSYRNNKSVHILHEFFPNAPPGFKIIETPRNVIYLPINTKKIDELSVQIVDQDGNLLNLRGEVVTIRLHLRKKF